MNSFTRLLADGFPSIAANPKDEGCILSSHYHSDRPEMSVISGAVDLVEALGGRSTLIEKLRREHPVDREHDEQHDERAFDVISEACAFAWATSVAGLGIPSFCMSEGAPDLRCDSGWWVEAKSINSSEENRARTRRMRETGEFLAGHVSEPSPGLLRKFQSAFADADRKFQRQGEGQFVVFFNLTSIDWPQIPIEEEVVSQLVRAVETLSAERPGVEVVLCYRYDWQHPVFATIARHTMT